jgi:hypothetical protein
MIDWTLCLKIIFHVRLTNKTLGSIINVSIYNIHTEEHLLSPKRTLVISYRTPVDRSRRVMKGTVTYVEREGKKKILEKKQ